MSSLAGAEVQVLLADAAGRAGRYLAGLDERAVAPDGAALAGLARFDEPLPEVAGDPAATLALVGGAGSAATVASAGGRYFGSSSAAPESILRLAQCAGPGARAAANIGRAR